MTKEEKETLKNLRNKGYKVLVWEPAQLEGANKEKLEEALSDAWWDVIDQIGVNVIPEVHMP